MTDYHNPVLLQSCIDFLQVRPGGIYVDGTLGGGGHTEGILAHETTCRVIAFDMDQDAIHSATERLNEFSGRFEIVHDNFRTMKDHLQRLGVSSVHGILLDLGVSSFQLDRSEKGFSYRFDAPLSMAMSDRATFTAQDVVNTYPEKELVRIFFEYGEEKQSRRIAKTIVTARTMAPIATTTDLAKVIQSVIPEYFAKKTLSRIFQALRIEVNDELNTLKKALNDGLEVLAPGGRFAVIAYHSLEDRIVKDFFRYEAADKILNEDYPELSQPKPPRVQLVTRKPFLPDETEISQNPRARSAKLRVAEKI